MQRALFAVSNKIHVKMVVMTDWVVPVRKWYVLLQPSSARSLKQARSQLLLKDHQRQTTPSFRRRHVELVQKVAKAGEINAMDAVFACRIKVDLVSIAVVGSIRELLLPSMFTTGTNIQTNAAHASKEVS